LHPVLIIQAFSENNLQSEPGRTHHRRQNSLSQALEGLDLEEAFPSENAEIHAVEEVCPDYPFEHPLEDISFDLSMSISSESKTARRRAEYNSKSKDVTFNQKKHMTPSYLRRLQRRKVKDDIKAIPNSDHPRSMPAGLQK
jgi:hypothetical protein